MNQEALVSSTLSSSFEGRDRPTTKRQPIRVSLLPVLGSRAVEGGISCGDASRGPAEVLCTQPRGPLCANFESRLLQEEIVRRQEASRYASPVPRFLSPEQSRERGLFRQGVRGEPSRDSLESGESSGDESDCSISSRRSLSPYRDKPSIFNGYRPAGQPYWVSRLIVRLHSQEMFSKGYRCLSRCLLTLC
jgi:hypothetical protein